MLASSAADAIGVRSLTLISPWGALSDLRDEARAAISAAAGTPGPQLTSALLPTVEARARSSCIAEAVAGGGGPLLLAPSLYLDASAALAGPALAERLAAAQATAADSTDRIPVLLATGGDKDLVEVRKNVSSTFELPNAVPSARSSEKRTEKKFPPGERCCVVAEKLPGRGGRLWYEAREARFLRLNGHPAKSA